MITWTLEFIFWFSLLTLFYAYAGYPLCAALLAFFLKKPVHKKSIYPQVTILIAAYNEEDSIAATLENKLSLDYPKDKLQIIVISDESEDQTDTIVESFRERGILLLRQSPRAGKTSALNLAIPFARGEILVFSDANSMYAPDAMQKLVANFADPAIGYVTGKMIYTNSDGSTAGDGCSAYMKYENKLRELETNLGSVVGVDGGIDAMRIDLYSPLNADQLPDFVQPLKVIEKGYRVVYESSALLKEATLLESGDEYRMRVRVTLRALWALNDMRGLLKGGGGMLFAWQLWSHKVLRYSCFVFLILVFLTNIWLATETVFFQILFSFQSACYIGAALSPVVTRLGRDMLLLRLLYYFVLLNVASLHAAMNYIKGKKQILWTPRKG
ncbi:MAG: glycosyltransferase involved in cell wall biosynthesis [Desulforhopalus sp.]|jgi:glycosyltransferase involved in cell wall biosynthesis